MSTEQTKTITFEELEEKGLSVDEWAGGRPAYIGSDGESMTYNVLYPEFVLQAGTYTEVDQPMHRLEAFAKRVAQVCNDFDVPAIQDRLTGSEEPGIMAIGYEGKTYEVVDLVDALLETIGIMDDKLEAAEDELDVLRRSATGDIGLQGLVREAARTVEPETQPLGEEKIVTEEWPFGAAPLKIEGEPLDLWGGLRLGEVVGVFGTPGNTKTVTADRLFVQGDIHAGQLSTEGRPTVKGLNFECAADAVPSDPGEQRQMRMQAQRVAHSYDYAMMDRVAAQVFADVISEAKGAQLEPASDEEASRMGYRGPESEEGETYKTW